MLLRLCSASTASLQMVLAARGIPRLLDLVSTASPQDILRSAVDTVVTIIALHVVWYRVFSIAGVQIEERYVPFLCEA